MCPSFKPKTSPDKFNILVVDDDPTSLSIVSALLKSWQYEALTVKSPVDALATVRARHDLMSSDDRESVILESLASGAVFYIVKPINPDDLKNVWQYAITSKKEAVPKKILECMNVPGLTRENVASHLQKYRLFLKRVAEKGIIVTTKNFSSRNVMEAVPQALNGGNIGSSQGYVSQLGLQLGNQANLYQPNFGTTNPLGQANLPTFGMGSNDFGNNLFSLGGMPGGLLNGTNPMQMYPRQSQARPDMNFGTPGIINNLPPNYAGMSITDYMELSPIGQMALDSNFVNAGCGLINPAHNDNMNIGPAGSATFGYFPPGESSSTEFDSANYPFQPAFASVNQQESTPILPPLQQYGLGRNDGQNNFTSDLMNNASVFGNPQELREGNISDILSGTTNCLFPYQLQEIEEAMNPDLENGSNPMDDYFPNNKETKAKVNSELNYLLMDTALSGNQEWDEFLNSLFKDHPF
ncbi:hypothetical protein Patl1_20064 [Pistacia atlantica]|uniref:Uncharacterized protein n=1 Tax=Pistacia atlantica TaxID=434234 RepID=A0ACC1BJJ5_9ROSI|nr:hypothetical protein Patl1_20064 [Pistacia atlantica]